MSANITEEVVVQSDEPPKPRTSIGDTLDHSGEVVQCTAKCSECIVFKLVKIGISQPLSHQQAHDLQKKFTDGARGFVKPGDCFTKTLRQQLKALQALSENFQGCHVAINGTRAVVLGMLEHAERTLDQAIAVERRLQG